MTLPANWTDGGAAFHATNENNVEAAVNTLQTTMSADYVITVAGSTYTATPVYGRSLSAYSGTNFTTVMQNAVNALTTGAPGAGSLGTGGGRIFITAGTYTMGNAVTITGWEGAGSSAQPQSQLIIQGSGGTFINQSTSGQHAFIIQNCANVSILDMFIYIWAAGSAIYGAKTGSTSEMSIWGGVLRVGVQSTSTTDPAIHLKNFFDMKGDLEVYVNSYHGIVLENDSATINYGNSNFGFIRSASAGAHNGLALSNVGSSLGNNKTINLITVNNYQCLGDGTAGGKGLYLGGLSLSEFDYCDIENTNTCIYVDGSGSPQNLSEYFTLNAGYISPGASGTGIYNSAYGGGNTFRCRIDTSRGSITVINDQNGSYPQNQFDVTFQTVADTNSMVFAYPGTQDIEIRAADRSYLNRKASQFTSTATAGGTTTMTIASTPIQVWTGSSTQTVKLPTTGIAAGDQYTIINTSSGNVTVQSSGANTIGSPLTTGQSAVYTALVNTPTTAANWSGH